MKRESHKLEIDDPIEIDQNESAENEKPKSKAKKKKQKTAAPNQNQNQSQSQNQNNDPNEINLEAPKMENVALQSVISQQDLPDDFGSSQAIGKIQKLLESGESIAFFTTAKIINFVKPKRIRKIVITSTGRAFFTNIGGDGVLGDIKLDSKSRVNIHNCDVKVYANKTFHFLFDNKEEGQKFVYKMKEYIDVI